MRINFVTPSIVGRRATSPQPTEVGSARRVGAQTTGVPARPAQLSRAGLDAIVSNVRAANVSVAPEPSVERRQSRRRGNDRRKQQVAVLIDTRVDQRRNSRRRDEDDAPRRVDTQA
jgi:hypothetical protein